MEDTNKGWHLRRLPWRLLKSTQILIISGAHTPPVGIGRNERRAEYGAIALLVTASTDGV